MTTQEKTNLIYKDISINYNIFCSQAKSKLHKWEYLIGKGREKELVSDVLFSIMNRMNSPIIVDKFYKMVLRDKFRLYVLKAVNDNAHYITGPFMREQMEIINRLPLFDDLMGTNMGEEELLERYKREESEDNKERTIIREIYLMLEPPRAIRIFGEIKDPDDWKYYSGLFKLYISTNLSYRKIAEKYQLPPSSISFHLRKCKDAIRNELKKTGFIE